MPRQENDGNETENVTDPVIPPPPKRNKKKKKEDDIGVELINVLNKNVEFRKAEEDEDRLFFLSLTPSFARNNNPPPPPPPSVPPTHRGTWNEGESVTSPESTYSQNTHMSQESDYLDLFNDNNSQ
ncbi:unnamed protein product [Pieris macdunnoughi]|uniref:Uncharacterized protein n=1 Tax=Pieris macdunnoughi TaxID=345717 RepID=A0A821UIW8_9NEOP|nr:unnamed protein product [Pieris macdunnoughi]